MYISKCLSLCACNFIGSVNVNINKNRNNPGRLLPNEPHVGVIGDVGLSSACVAIVYICANIFLGCDTEIGVVSLHYGCTLPTIRLFFHVVIIV